MRGKMEIQVKCDNAILDDAIQLDVGGTVFKTRKSTLHSVPGSLLASLDKNAHTKDRSGNMYCFDRDASIFRHILNAHREGEIHVPRDICPILFKKEMQYWGIPLAMLAPCCWKQFYDTVEDTKTLLKIFKQEKLTEFRNQIGITECKDDTTFKQDITKIRDKNRRSIKTEIKHTNKLWLILEEPASSLTAKVWCFFYLAVVIFSVVVFIMLDYESVRVSPYLGQNNINMDYFSLTEENITYILTTRKINKKLFLLATSDPHPTLFAMDAACVFFFIMETIVHFSACPRKRTYLKNQYNVIKIFLSMSMIIAFTIEFQTNDAIEHRNLGYSYLAFKSMNILRLFLLFRLRKLYSGLHILLLAVEQSMQELVLLCLAFSIGITVYGSLMYSAEITTEAFPNVLVSMWWALITMSTIGYGDFVPTCTAGYIVGSLCAVSGLIVISMVISAVAAKFSGLYSRNSDLEMHKEALQEEHKCIKLTANKVTVLNGNKHQLTNDLLETVSLMQYTEAVSNKQ